MELVGWLSLLFWRIPMGFTWRKANPWNPLRNENNIFFNTLTISFEVFMSNISQHGEQNSVHWTEENSKIVVYQMLNKTHAANYSA